LGRYLDVQNHGERGQAARAAVIVRIPSPEPGGFAPDCRVRVSGALVTILRPGIKKLIKMAGVDLPGRM
jgi:hypothetical protein